MRKRILIAILVLLAIAGLAVYQYGRSLWFPVYRRIRGGRTVADVVERYGSTAEERLRPHFDRAGVAHPPQRIALLALKAEKRLELWAEREGSWTHIRSYPILAASGRAGPKLKEGDRQVPEGIYKIIALNPNSSYHLSMKLDYPNEFDRRKAKLDSRFDLGGDIFIHGKAASIGCIAVGDEAIEELFALTAGIGRANVAVIIAPNDLRTGEPVASPESGPPWAGELHETLKQELALFVRPERRLAQPRASGPHSQRARIERSRALPVSASGCEEIMMRKIIHRP